jgi:hypothetical protein
MPWAMSMPPTSDDRPKGRIKGDAGRRDRLAAELRENLRRRKARLRGAVAATPDEPTPVEPWRPSSRVPSASE